MAEKVLTLKLQRDYILFLYYVNGNGDVCRKRKDGTGSAEVLIEGAVVRQPNMLYFIDKDGDVGAAPRALPKKKQQAGQS